MLEEEVAKHRLEGSKLVFTNGCFDILHVGHTKYLAEAKNQGDYLIVAINTDSSVKSLKGDSRPINSLRERMDVLSALQAVDYVCSFNEETPLNIIKKLRPHILVKGSDYKIDDVVGKQFIESYGGTVELIPFIEGFSSTDLINRIKSL